MKRKHLMTLMTLVLVVGAAGSAGAGDLDNTPGYVDLEWIDIPDDAAEIQDIDLGVVLLGIAADAEENRDEALLQALSMIKSIRVKSWSMEHGDSSAEKAVDKIAKHLKKDGWKRLIYVKDDDEMVTVSTRHVDQDMVGLMLVTYEPGDAVAFVNVVGDLDLGTMFRLVKEFEEESIESMLEELEDLEGVEINHN